MATQCFDLEVPLSQEDAIELLDRHYRSLGYRVEQSDRINQRLVVDRGWLIGAVLGGPIRRRHVWVHAQIRPAGRGHGQTADSGAGAGACAERMPEADAGAGSSSVHIEYRGVGRALAKDARALHRQEVAAFQARCRSYRPPKDPAGVRPQTVLREVFIKEVVRIPCPYCGAMVENTARRCDACGAPL